ncbi:response regulator [Kribbella sp. NPDC050124]|uniref:response regulator n=1 Tax=Kribbella sp. NPDC050124 TaxID=3364114 RepID=UPI0037BD967A
MNQRASLAPEEGSEILADVKRQLLLVEDDARVRRVLALSLEREGYAVTEAPTAQQALDAMSTAPPYDVVLLDIMLPDDDGFTVCRAIRKHSDVPVIMITARDDSHDVVAGLEAGADDYVTKPLIAKELAARIRALLRRSQPKPSTQNRYKIGDLVVDLDTAEVTRAGTPVPLTRTEFRLLAELAQAGPGLCSREQLLEKVWGYDYFGDSRIVDVHISRLRAKIESDSDRSRHLVTVRGMGYRLVD